jgi:periplasmic divalent cation tolerance protein
MKGYIQVFTTVEKREDADFIASAVVETRMAACAQIVGPIHSIYWWKGKMEQAAEWLCVMKTRQELFLALERQIKSVHPYEVPEIVALPIVAGSKSYLDWIEEETAK